MGTPTVTNILKSNAVLWYAPYGESEPDETDVSNAKLGTDGPCRWQAACPRPEPAEVCQGRTMTARKRRYCRRTVQR